MLTDMKKAGIAAVFAIGATLAVPTAVLADEPDDAGLAAETLADGNSFRAISLLQSELEQHPDDPALLINLGIAQAQAGFEAEARANFEAALSGRQEIELETADGRETDSRRLARLALAMLERGEFRPVQQRADRITLRD